VAISEHTRHFAGRPVRDWAPGRGIASPTRVIYRLRQDYESEAPLLDQLTEFLADPAAKQIPGLVIGMWGEDMVDSPPAPIFEALVKAKDRLPNLRALFVGDITYEECEISWIEQGDMAPLFKAFPKLEHFRVRGGNKLTLGKLNLANLKSLVVEAGGLPQSVVQEVAAAKLPALEHLALWLGVDDYGGNATVDDLRPILDGGLFPRLRYLGLRDSGIADDVAEAAALAPVLEQVRVLDLSLGTLGDRGAQALLASPPVARLEKLDIHHHFVSKELVKRLAALGMTLDARDRKEPDKWDGEEHRYVAVAE
jgi:hypothetical protein